MGSKLNEGSSFYFAICCVSVRTLAFVCLIKERCLFLSLVKQAKWHFASSAVRSPPSILVRNLVSWRSVAIFTFLLAAEVRNLWRWPSSFSQKIHLLWQKVDDVDVDVSLWDHYHQRVHLSVFSLLFPIYQSWILGGMTCATWLDS